MFVLRCYISQKDHLGHLPPHTERNVAFPIMVGINIYTAEVLNLRTLESDKSRSESPIFDLLKPGGK